MEKDALAKLLKLNEHLTVIVYDYVSNTNLKDDGSQGGHVVLMTNKWEKYFSPYAGKLKK